MDPNRETVPPMTGVANPAAEAAVGATAAELDEDLEQDDEDEDLDEVSGVGPV